MAEDDRRQWWEKLPGTPVDSLVQLERFGIPKGKVHSCSKPDGKNNAGCPAFETCDLSFKDTGDGTARPHNGGIEIIKHGGTGVVTIRQFATCFGYNMLRRALDDMEGVVDWVADEGETFCPDETALKQQETLPGQPLVFAHERVERERPVPKFKCLVDLPQTRDALRLEERRMKIAMQRDEKRRNRLIGVADEVEEKRGTHEGAVAVGSEKGPGAAQPASDPKAGGGGSKSR